jgi:hypothetical protein
MLDFHKWFGAFVQWLWKKKTMKNRLPLATFFIFGATTFMLPLGDNAMAEETAAENNFFAQTSVYTHHFFPSPVHENHNRLVNLEWQTTSYTQWGADRTLFGLAVFKNSFGQPSEYVYAGQRWDVNENVYLKLTVGLLHGYKDPYQNKIPLNHYGVAPAIVPSIGLRFMQATFETIFLSNRAVMLAIGFQF